MPLYPPVGSMDYRGAWAAATAYAVGDVVVLDGVASVCITANTGIRPTAMGHLQNLGSAGNASAGQTTTVLSPSSKSVTLGDTIVVGWGAYYKVTPTGVTDNLGNVYTLVESRGSTRGAALYSAPVTVAGAITTITVSHPSTQYVAIMAAEFGNMAPSAVGAGLNAASGTPATWVDSKTIPARGLAVGWVICSTATVETAGAASGTPSTPIVLSGSFLNGAAVSGSLAYASAGESDVTAFSGTTTFASGAGTDWVGAGGLFTTAWQRLALS